MDMYNIPGDTGKPFRRRVVQNLLQGTYIDGATDYCLLIPFADKAKLSPEERVWLAYLYGLSYSCTTAIRMFEAMPDPNQVKGKLIKGFWKAEKPTLYFNPDKKYIKNNDQVIPAIKSVKDDLGGTSLLSRVVEVSQNGDSFEGLYRYIQKTWRFFGPHGSYLFLDALYGLCPEVYVDPTGLDWKNGGKTVVEGMAHMLYQDELIQTRQFPLDRYDRAVDLLQKTTGQPKVIIESVLCAFRKLFKGTRYVGYYADRMLEECTFVDTLKGVYTKPDVWGLRKASIPKELRGEDQGWDGIRKDQMKRWLERGEP